MPHYIIYLIIILNFNELRSHNMIHTIIATFSFTATYKSIVTVKILKNKKGDKN